MKNANLPILLVVLVLVAVAAQFSHHPREKLEVRQDLEKCLQLLWGLEEQKVELVPTGLRATVHMSPGVSPRQRRWNYPFLRFAALRHADLTVQSVEVIDGSSLRAIPEVATNGMLAARSLIPTSDSQFEERASLLTARKLNLELEKELDRGEALALVDAHQTRAETHQVRYGAAADEELAYRHDDPIQVVMNLEVCLVLKDERKLEALRQFKVRNLHNGEKMRLLKLPPT